MFSESDLNRLGYRYVAAKKFAQALVIFKTNTQVFPNSPNTFDSYAEALAMNQQDKLALENYEKAVAVATKQNHWGLEGFQKNLKAFQEKNQ